MNKKLKTQKKDQVKQCIWNLLSSGLPVDYEIEALRKILLINLITLLAFFVIIVLGIIEFILEDYLLVSVNFIFFLFVSGMFIYLRKTKNYELISLAGTILSGFFYSFLIAHGGIGSTTYMWLFTYPLIAIFLLGIRKGTVFSLLLLLMACLVFVFGEQFEFLTSYDISVKIRFIPTYLTIFFLLIIIEKTRMIAQEKRERSEARFRTLFTNAPIPLVNVTLNGSVIDVNNKFTKVMGYTRDDISHIEHWWEQVFPDPEYRKEVMSEWENAISQAASDHSDINPLECHIVTQKGHLLRMMVGGNLLGDTMLVSFFDITDRVEKEAALQENMELLRATFNATPDGILVVNKDLKITQANHQFYKMWRIPPELREIDNDDILREYIQDQLAVPEIFNERIDSLYSSHVQDMQEIPLKDGRVFERYTVPMIIEDKEIGRVWDFRDISEQKRVEQALRSSEHKLRSIFEAMTDIIIIFDKEGWYLEVGQTNSGSLLHDPNQLVGKSIKDMFSEEQANFVLEAIAESLTHKKPVSIDHEIEIGDQRLWFTSVISPLSSDKVICVARDISERKNSENERENLQKQLYQSQKLEAIGLLAGGVAHDFNNMLAGIMGYAELTIKEMDPSDPLQKNLYTILDIAKRSASLTRQLLSFARKQTIEPITFDLNEAIESILKMIRRLIGENIELAWLPGTHSATVSMDPSQFDQVMINLCVNARDAISNTGRITIETDTVSFDAAYCSLHAYFTSGDYVLLAVSDDGCGMDNNTLNHIFEPFFTTKGTGQGTGMGLPTVYGIVKQNKGFINAYSESGQGTTIKIYLPLGTMAANDEETTTIENIPHSRGESILIVEDEPSLLEMNLIMLQHLGYSTLSAGTPKEAISILQDSGNKIHLVFTDVIMPEMNGRELVDQLKRIQPEIKHLFMSGYTANIIAHQGVLNKGVNFIQKPYTLKNLAVKIREALS